ncbi:MAG: sensor domain-containing protein [Mycobacterium sp.]|nr:sensor domain-containing protein [Mycobacterium sp.]
MKRYALGGAVLCLTLVACGGNTGAPKPATPTSVAESSLDGLLLKKDVLDSALGTTGLVPTSPTEQMDDHRNLLPNLNCLGVWQIDEAAIYSKDGKDMKSGQDWKSMRQQRLRAPDAEAWDYLVAQSVVLYPTADQAKAFFDQSAERWAKCTNHHVNIRLNDKPLPKWLSGDLQRTDTQLAMPITRGTDAQTRWCQHVLQLAANVIIDVEACTPKAPVTAAADIAGKIQAGMH